MVFVLLQRHCDDCSGAVSRVVGKPIVADFSWDDMGSQTQDKQKAAERVAYRQGIWWIEECVVRSEGAYGQILGVIRNRTLISNAQVPKELERSTVSLAVTDHLKHEVL